MTESIENIVLEHLCYIRRSMDELRLDIADLKTRVTAIEITTAQIVTLLAAQSSRMNRIEDRLARVERRLELVEA